MDILNWLVGKAKELTTEGRGCELDWPNTSLRLLHSLEWHVPYYSLLFYVAKEFKPNVMVEIGTDEGIGTVHLALGNPKGKVHTIDIREECRGFLEGYSFYKDIDNVEIITGDSQNVVSNFSDEQIDMLFIDGDHTYEGEKRDYVLYLPKVKKGSIILIDDIGNDDVRQVWDEIIDQPKVKLPWLRPHEQGFGAVVKEH